MLKEKWGGDLKPLISEKIYLVPGDISSPNMGLNDSNLLEEMKNQVEIIINFAATTNFDERYWLSRAPLNYKMLKLKSISNWSRVCLLFRRYDVAFGTNTLGAKHVVNFAKGCSNLEILVHVSTGQYEIIFFLFK